VEKKHIDFIVVGAGKSGTSWLQGVFDRSSDVFVPKIKEVHYFNKEGLDSIEGATAGINPNFGKGIEWYHDHFDLKSGQVVGEISPSYLWSESAPVCINEYCPNIKLIVVLRNPAKRAISQYQYLLQRGYLPKGTSFKQACSINNAILTRGLYGYNLERYFAIFRPEQILVLKFEDLIDCNGSGLKKIAAFLGVSGLVYAKDKQNASGSPRFPVLTYHSRRFVEVYPKVTELVRNTLKSLGVFSLVKNVLFSGGRDKMEVDDSDISWLTDYYASDLEKVENILDWDLSAWR